MSKLATLAALALAATALAVPAALAAPHPGQTVEIKSTITVNPYANGGKVSATNPACTDSRKVVIKEVGFGKIGATTTSSTGSWKAEPDYKGDVPLKVYAEVKPVTEGTAGTNYKCLGAKSKTKTIEGG